MVENGGFGVGGVLLPARLQKWRDWVVSPSVDFWESSSSSL